jgi:hypothetical protein
LSYWSQKTYYQNSKKNKAKPVASRNRFNPITPKELSQEGNNLFCLGIKEKTPTKH